MAWTEVKCSRCGKAYDVQMYGSHKTREWRVKNWEGLCDQCKEIVREEKLDEARRKAMEDELPKLVGTEKQVRWAKVALLGFSASLKKRNGSPRSKSSATEPGFLWLHLHVPGTG